MSTGGSVSASGGMGGDEPAGDGGVQNTGGKPAGDGGSSGGGMFNTGGVATGGAMGGMGGEPSTCESGVRDGDETGVDCGGDCAPCTPASTRVPFIAGRSSDLEDSSPNGLGEWWRAFS